MEGKEFANRLFEIEEQRATLTGVPVMVRIEGFAPLSVTNLHPEIHEDDGSMTLWITAEEM